MSRSLRSGRSAVISGGHPARRVSSRNHAGRHSAATRKRASLHGFSMLELTVVVALSMMLAAMAIPTITTQVAQWRLHTTANEIAGLLQNARLQAVRSNTYVTLRTATVNGATIAYVDSSGTSASDGYSGDGAYNSGETAVQIPATISFTNTGAPSFDSTSLMGVSVATTDVSPGIRITFNGRGLPCLKSGSVCTTVSSGNPVAFVYYATNQSLTNGWMAVSVAPAGRIHVWMWNGNAWQ